LTDSEWVGAGVSVPTTARVGADSICKAGWHPAMMIAISHKQIIGFIIFVVIGSPRYLYRHILSSGTRGYDARSFHSTRTM
jgi:hypothetical protein